MILKIILIFGLLSTSTLGQNPPSNDTKTLINYISAFVSDYVQLLDGPLSVSCAATTPTTNKRPTLDQILYYNNYAAAMYCQYELNDLSCDICQEFNKDVFAHTVIMNNDTDCTAIVTVSKTRQEIVVAIRGSMNIWNLVLSNIMFAVTYPNIPSGVKIHLGFHTAAMSLYDEVVENVGLLRSFFPTFKIVITGHSLGGAISRIIQFYLLALKQFPGAKYECYTYGEPRSGNYLYADYMNAQNITTVRVVNRGDIVPHATPTSVLSTDILGDYFIHCQPEYFYEDVNNQRYCDTDTYEDPLCSISLGPVYSISEHITYMEVYYGTCLFGQPVPWTALPFSIFQPVGIIPPLPKFISNFLDASIRSALGLLGLVGL